LQEKRVAPQVPGPLARGLADKVAYMVHVVDHHMTSMEPIKGSASPKPRGAV